MAITKEKKRETAAKLRKIAAEANAVAFVNFHGLTVANVTELRRKLRSEGVSYLVAKKTLARKAFADSGIAGALPELPGELGIAYGADPVAPAREIFSFQKKFENKISLVGGVFEKAYADKEKITALASIPPLPALRAEFAALINSPIQRLVSVLGEVAKARV